MGRAHLFHIAQHGISRDDIEIALGSKTMFIKDEVRNGENQRTVLGMAGDKRILVVITTPRAGKVRCVTASSKPLLQHAVCIKVPRSAAVGKLKMPDFQTDAEEAAWWFDNQDAIGEEHAAENTGAGHG